jgi:hypothetical protein
MTGAVSGRQEAASTDKRAELPRLAVEIEKAHCAVKDAGRTALLYAKHAGDLLVQAKARLPHGAWLPWLVGHCDIAARTAQLYMQLAKRWSEIQEFLNTQPDTHLDLNAARLILSGRRDLLNAPFPSGNDTSDGDGDGDDPPDDDGCGNDDDDEDDEANDDAIQKVALTLSLTVRTARQFNAQLQRLVRDTGKTESDLMPELVAAACAHLPTVRVQ